MAFYYSLYKPTYVLYFDQISGAARTRKLVEMLFLTVFNVNTLNNIKQIT